MWRYNGSYLSGHFCFFLGHFIDAHNRYQGDLSLWDPKFRIAAPPPIDPHLTVLVHDSRALLCLGYLDQARLRRCEGLTESRQLSPCNRVFAPATCWVGDWTIEDADELWALANDQGFTSFGAMRNLMRGWVPDYTRPRSGRSAADASRIGYLSRHK
jgi:hypothetical protein